jgi:hypothetical protein
MKNLSIALKRFLGNKNTVTFLCIIGAALALYIGYNYRINQATSPVKVAYARETIQPRTEITEDQIAYKKVPASAITKNTIILASQLIGKYTNYNTIIPEGSLFYEEAVIKFEELPDAAFSKVKKGDTVYNFSVDMISTYGNSLFPGNKIDVYYKDINDSGEMMYGQLFSDIEILTVKDNKGVSVFQNSNELGTPSMLLFALPNKMYLILKRAYYLTKFSTAEIVVVPVTETTTADPTITSSYLIQHIETRTADVPQDEIENTYQDSITEDKED